MTPTMLLFALAGFLLSVVCAALGMWVRQHAAAEADQSADLFHDWNRFTPEERRRILAGHRRRVLARLADQEKAWLRERLGECAKG
ncbi:hypothetical protein [Azotobacter salinestris]